MTYDMPKPIRTPEAFAQLHVKWWRFVEAAIPPVELHADERAVQALADAVELRASIVGHEQACRDYFGEEDTEGRP